MRRWTVIILTLLFTQMICVSHAHANKTLREVARIKGQGASVIQGIGLVVGLDGTGDSGSELAMARPLAEALKNFGNPVSVDDLASSKSAALVMVTCEVPREGAKTDDRYAVTVAVLNSAKSLKGGVLMVSPLIAGPGSPVYAFSQGALTLQDPENPTVAHIARGAQMVRDINTTPTINGSFDLIIDQSFSGWGASASIASEINQQYLLTGDRNQSIALPLDARTVRVTVPLNERGNPASFFGDIMETDISSSLRKLPAKVICDTRSGIIVITGDVLVSAAVITHKDLSITTTVPIPGLVEPQTSEFAAINTDSPDDASKSRLNDLISAFDQLDIPPVEQISIIRMLHETGKLHARLIIDGKE